MSYLSMLDSSVGLTLRSAVQWQAQWLADTMSGEIKFSCHFSLTTTPQYSSMSTCTSSNWLIMLKLEIRWNNYKTLDWRISFEGPCQIPIWILTSAIFHGALEPEPYYTCSVLMDVWKESKISLFFSLWLYFKHTEEQSSPSNWLSCLAPCATQ